MTDTEQDAADTAELDAAEEACRHMNGTDMALEIARLRRERDAALARVGEWIQAMPRCWNTSCDRPATFSFYSGESQSDDQDFCDEHAAAHRMREHDEMTPKKWAHLIRAATGGKVEP